MRTSTHQCKSFWLFLDELKPPTRLVPKPSPSLYLFMATTITTSFFIPPFSLIATIPMEIQA